MSFLTRIFRRPMSIREVVERISLALFKDGVEALRTLIAAQHFPRSLGTTPDRFNSLAWDLFLEWQALSLHLIDRAVFNALGPDHRARFMRSLVLNVASSLPPSMMPDAPNEVQARLAEMFVSLYNSRQSLYGTLRLPSGEEATSKGSLFSEAAMILAKDHLSQESASAAVALLPTLYRCGRSARTALSLLEPCRSK